MQILPITKIRKLHSAQLFVESFRTVVLNLDNSNGQWYVAADSDNLTAVGTSAVGTSTSVHLATTTVSNGIDLLRVVNAPLIDEFREYFAPAEISLTGYIASSQQKHLPTLGLEWEALRQLATRCYESLHVLRDKLNDDLQADVFAILRKVETPDSGRYWVLPPRESVERLSKSLDVEIAKIRKQLVRTLARMGDVPQDSYEEKKELADSINRLVSRLGVSVICPTCSRPGRLKCTLPGNSKAGIFLIDHATTSHSLGGSLPNLSVGDAAVDKRRLGRSKKRKK